MGTNDAKPINVKWLARTAILLALTLAFQMIGLPQPVTGPAVNAMLLISGTYVGALGGIIIGLLTPLIAFARGILPPPLAPMIPFIMLGNATGNFIFTDKKYIRKEIHRLCSSNNMWRSCQVFNLICCRKIYSKYSTCCKAMQTPQLLLQLLVG